MILLVLAAVYVLGAAGMAFVLWPLNDPLLPSPVVVALLIVLWPLAVGAIIAGDPS